MQLEHQFCTRKQAVRLDKLDLKAESVFVWCDGADEGTYYIDKLEEVEFDLSKGLNPGEWYYAYSCAELWWLFEIVLEHEKSHTLTYAFLHLNATAMYKSEIPAAHYLADKIIEALKIEMVKPEELTLI